MSTSNSKASEQSEQSDQPKQSEKSKQSPLWKVSSTAPLQEGHLSRLFERVTGAEQFAFFAYPNYERFCTVQPPDEPAASVLQSARVALVGSCSRALRWLRTQVYADQSARAAAPADESAEKPRRAKSLFERASKFLFELAEDLFDDVYIS